MKVLIFFLLSIIQNALWSWQPFGLSGFLKAVLIFLFTLFISSPFSHPFWLSAALAAGLMAGDNGSWGEDIDFSFLLYPTLFSPPRWNVNVLFFSHFLDHILHYNFDSSFSLSISLCLHFSLHVSLYTLPHTLVTSYVFFVLFSVFSDPGAVVETHSAVPYAVIGGVLALLVFTVICVLIVTIWCSVRQKGNTHAYTLAKQ